ncbi:hypothetical protein C8R47DRAFT_1228842 [Mycena vitilis]|nr:hypothetical protein C8R47DRAFT_1228836 [Mycena vitilis]KAJ6454019.1 hypothetical protein C8R47DRAFT_1228842 [Mycena vitilis]
MQDGIPGVQRYIEEWGLVTDQELKQLHRDAKAEVDAAVEEAEASARAAGERRLDGHVLQGHMRGRKHVKVHY